MKQIGRISVPGLPKHSPVERGQSRNNWLTALCQLHGDYMKLNIQGHVHAR